MNDKVTFLLKLAQALHRYGTNSPRIERAMYKIANSLSVNGSFIVTPTSIMISIENDDDHIHRIKRVEPGHVNLEKLGEVDRIADMVASADITVEEATISLETLLQRSDLYPAHLKILSFGLASFSLAVLFGGSLSDSAASAIIGFILGLLSVIEKKTSASGVLFLSTGSFICTLVAALLKFLIPELHFQIIVMASLIVIIPGLTLTIAMIELSADHLVSGTARLMGVVVNLFKISIGVMGAVKVSTLFFGTPAADHSTPLHTIWTLPCIFLGAVAFVIIFNARMKDFGWFLISGGISILTIQFLSDTIGSETAIFLAALLVGGVSNIFARLLKRPALTMILPGIIFLVPGSIGFRGINLIVDNNSVAGMDMALQTLSVSMLLVAGLFFANYVINPRRSI